LLFILSVQVCQAYNKDNMLVNWYDTITITDSSESGGSSLLNLNLYTFPYIE